jgi:hypothetical protein
MPDLFDVIELTVDIPGRGLHVGMQGTIVHCHPGDVYEVEFTDEAGETLDFLALRLEQFIGSSSSSSGGPRRKSGFRPPSGLRR